MTSFYVQLPSNTNVQGNKTSDFRVRLAKKLHFNSEWVVGLAVISYPHSWPSIGTNEPQFIQIHWNIPLEIKNSKYNTSFIQKLLTEFTKIEVPKSKHVNAERLENAINTLVRDTGRKYAADLEKTLQETNNIRIRTSLDPKDPSNTSFDKLVDCTKQRISILKDLTHHLNFEYHSEFQRFRIYYSGNNNDTENYTNEISKQNCINFIQVSQQLAYVLGLESTATKIPASGSYTPYAPDMLGGISSLYVYAPGLIEPVLLGDTTAPLLRIVHVKGKPDDNVEDIYAAVQYHKLLVKEVSEIKIEIRTATGRLVPFEYGTCLLTLHFRKLPYY